MKVKMLEDYRHNGETLYEGNIYPLPDNVGSAICEAGLAEDVDGSVETGNKDPNKRVVISPDNVQQGSTISEVV